MLQIYELHRLNCQFRILALSATPGSDKRAVQNVKSIHYNPSHMADSILCIQVLYNLHISKLEWRSEDDPDVAPYVQAREVYITELTV
jgi:ERCC4-related helicase